mgnify:FL=1|tara:strand:+ start:879 stop:1448 length:570 start_codon:yes stop_codon:yes gene_type:complete
MPEIPKNANAPGYFIGSDNRGNPQSGALIGEDGTETPSVAIVWSEQTPAPEKPSESLTGDQGEPPVPQSGPERIDLEGNGPAWIAQTLLRHLPFHVFTSPNQPQGKAWFFGQADAYMVNTDDWYQACMQVSNVFRQMAEMETVIDPRLPDPYDDPQVGPVLAMSGGAFMSVTKKDENADSIADGEDKTA